MNLVLAGDLRRTRAKIERPEKWGRKHDAVNAAGEPVNPTSKTACKFCIVGATYAAFCRQSINGDSVYLALSRVPRIAARPDRSIIGFNDDLTTTHADLLAVIDEAITLAEAP